MTKLFFILSLLPAVALADLPDKRNLHLEYSYGERASCRTDLTMEIGEEYLACELKIDGKRAFVRVSVTPRSSKASFVAMKIETIADDGHIKVISAPKFENLEGTTSSMRDSSENKPESSQEISVRVTRP